MGWDNDVGWIPPSSYATPGNQGFCTERNLFNIMNFWDLAWKQNSFLPWLKRCRDLFYSWCYHNQGKERSKEKLSFAKIDIMNFADFRSIGIFSSHGFQACKEQFFITHLSYISLYRRFLSELAKRVIPLTTR